MNTSYSNKKFIIDTNQAPRAIGPYSQGVSFGGLLFVSGQIPVDPQSGEIISGGIEAQTRQVMNNLQAVLMAAGLDFSHVLKTTVFLRNMNDYALMNDVYGLYFDYSPPARACVEVSRLPKDVLVEVECVAAAPTDYEDRANPDSPVETPPPLPDQWESEHIAEAHAAHASFEPLASLDTESEAESAVDALAALPPVDGLGVEASENNALDALDSLEEARAEESDEVVEELDESEVFDESTVDPLEIPSIPTLPASASARPAPARIAKLKLPKRDLRSKKDKADENPAEDGDEKDED